MGTNFSFITKNKETVHKYAPDSYKVADFPYFGYIIHMAKTSMGWLPLFEAHDGIRSIKEYKEAYDTGEFEIYNENGEEYTWDEFDKRVLKFNGGILGVKKPHKLIKAKDDSLDECIPEYGPISHIPGTSQSYKYRFKEDTQYMFKDPEGYEFTWDEFE